MRSRPSFIHVGTIVAAHGVRGQLKIRSLLSSPEELISLSPLTDKTGERTFHFSRQGIQEDVLIVSMQGVNDRNAAEALKGAELYAVSDRLPEPPPGQWYHADLIGLAAQLESGARYGVVSAVHNFGAGDIIEIEIGGNKTEMLPFKEPYVGRVHPPAGYIIVRPPEYIESGKES